MSVFFDTSVLLYCTDVTDPERCAKAKQLVAQTTLDGQGVVSTQVLIELFHNLTRKQKIPVGAARAVVLTYTAHWTVIDSDMALVSTAMEHAEKHQHSVWDAMIIQAAIRSGASTLYSEDMGHGERYGKLTIINPFRDISA